MSTFSDSPEHDAPASHPDLTWLDRFPALAALRDRGFEALGVRWASERRARAEGASMAELYAGTWQLGVLWSDQLWAMCREEAQGLLRVASCPEVPGGTGVNQVGSLFLRPERPDELLFAPGLEVPTALWLPVPAEAGALRAVLHEFYPPRRVPRTELTHVRRAFVGYIDSIGLPNPYSGQLESATPHALDRHITFSPHLDVKAWGSAFIDDPWPQETPPLGPVYIATNHQARAQREGAALASVTYRTLYSRAHVTFEIHQDRFYVVEVRYRPSAHGRVIDRLNERLGTAFPLDLPFDVVGALVGFGWAETPDVERALHAQIEAEPIAAYLQVVAALRYADLRVTEILQRYLDLDDPRVRGAIANLSVYYNWEFMLENLALREGEPKLSAFLRRVLDGGIGPPRFDALGRPVSLSAGGIQVGGEGRGGRRDQGGEGGEAGRGYP
jgi:hypothetical protein